MADKEAQRASLSADSMGNHSFSEECEEELQQEFETVRILVIGKSGAGKSTLIRRLFGLDPDAAAGLGPAGGTSGRAGVQDITREWRHPTLPIVVHDSNGVGSSGAKDVEAVAAFVAARQREAEPAGRLHLAWYVVSALDPRVAEDAGLLAAVVAARPGLALQLVVTHMDADPRGWAYAQNLGGGQLDALLRKAGVAEASDRTEITGPGRLVKVSNGKEVDVAALQKLSERTLPALREEQARSWAAAQKVDVRLKARESARFIVRQKLWAVITAPLGVLLDMFNRWRMHKILGATGAGLCKLWAVPEQLKRILCTAAMPPDSTFAKARWAAMTAAGLPAMADTAFRLAADAIDQTLPPGGGTGIAWLLTAGASAWNEAYASRAALLNYAMAVGGGIVYTKAVSPRSLDAHSAVTDAQYQAVLDEFAAKHQTGLQKAAEETRSVFLEPIGRDDQRLAIERLLENFFLSLLSSSQIPQVGSSNS